MNIEIRIFVLDLGLVTKSKDKQMHLTKKGILRGIFQTVERKEKHNKQLTVSILHFSITKYSYEGIVSRSSRILFHQNSQSWQRFSTIPLPFSPWVGSRGRKYRSAGRNIVITITLAVEHSFGLIWRLSCYYL